MSMFPADGGRRSQGDWRDRSSRDQAVSMVTMLVAIVCSIDKQGEMEGEQYQHQTEHIENLVPEDKVNSVETRTGLTQM